MAQGTYQEGGSALSQARVSRKRKATPAVKKPGVIERVRRTVRGMGETWSTMKRAAVQNAEGPGWQRTPGGAVARMLGAGRRRKGVR